MEANNQQSVQFENPNQRHGTTTACGSVCNLEESIHLTVDDRQCDPQLGRVVSHHDENMSVRHGAHELVDGYEGVGDKKAQGAGARAQFRPRPQVVEDLNPGGRAPRHEADQRDVEPGKVNHWTRQPRI